MNILFVAPWIPSRIRPRSWGLLRILSREHSVWVVAACTSGESVEDLRDLPLAGISLVRRRRLSALWRTARASLSRVPLQVALLDEPGMHRAIRRAQREVQADILHFNVVRSAAWWRVVSHRQIPTVFDLDDVRSDYYAQLRSGRNVLWRVIGWVETPRLRALEMEILNNASASIVSSPVDTNRFDLRTFLVRSPSEIKAETPAPGNRGQSFGSNGQDGQPREILFVGRLGYHANRDALDFYLTHVWPEVHRQEPSVVLTIVGEDPSGLYTSDSSKGIHVTGYVPSVEPYYQRASVAIGPVRLATGVQMKLIQALSAGVPFITSPICATQSGVPEDAVALASDASEWVQATLKVLRDPEYAQRLSRTGRAWALAACSDTAIEAQLLAAYAHALGEPSLEST